MSFFERQEPFVRELSRRCVDGVGPAAAHDYLLAAA